MHETTLLTDLAWIMLAAAVAALIFQKIKLPPLIGYLVAGFLLGPNLELWPPLVTLANVQELSELGVIFLMFYIGLEFDFNRLKQVFAPASTALALQTLLMLFIGLQASQWLGLSVMDGWFLGGILSISSSMVSVKLMRERGVFNRPHGQQAVGILVFEDILAMLLLVLLNGMAAEGSMDYADLGQTAFFIGIFVVAIFLIGKLAAPKLIQALEERGTTESITMATLGLIFAVSLVADQFHLSWALGGFLAGAILSRSRLAERIEHLTEPLRDCFSALFFVAVGMLIDPRALWGNAPAIFLISGIVIVGKFCACWLGLFLAGQTAKDSGRASLIKSQIGEFGFVITAIGAKYGATSPELQSIASGVAFVTILATPALIQNELRILGALEKLAPSAAKEFCSLYARWQDALELSYNRSVLRLARKPILRICIHFLIINAILIAAGIVSDNVVAPEFIPVSHNHFQQGLFLVSLLISLPFLVDTVRNLNVLVLLFSDAALSQRVFQQFSSGAYRSVFNGLILILLLFVYGSVFMIVAAPYFPTGTILAAYAAAALVLGAIFWKNLIHMHNHWEMAFLDSMKSESKERIEKQIASNLSQLRSQKPWEVRVEPIQLGEHSFWAGSAIKNIDIRKETGATIAGIERSGFELTDINADSRVYPLDRIFVLGEPNQIADAKRYLARQCDSPRLNHSPFIFKKAIVPPLCPWNGMTIKEMNIKRQFGVTIVGLQREDTRIISPSPEQTVLSGDLLLAMGSKEKLDAFEKELNPIEA